MKKVYVFPVCRKIVCRNEILAGSSPHISEEGDVNIGGQSSAGDADEAASKHTDFEFEE